MTPEEKYQRKLHRFQEWSADHPDVWLAFETLALKALAKGQRVSHWMIANVLRFERQVTLGLGKLSIGNDYIGFYARKFMAAEPSTRGGYFEIHRMIGEDFEATKIACGVK